MDPPPLTVGVAVIATLPRRSTTRLASRGVRRAPPGVPRRSPASDRTPDDQLIPRNSHDRHRNTRRPTDLPRRRGIQRCGRPPRHGLLTVLLLRLPWTYPVLLLVVDAALAALLVGNLTGSAGATHLGGWLVFVFVAFVVYFYAASLWEETGGRALPLGRPLVE
ncbi:hypothetical protein EB72_13520 [Mycobacterium sp. SWH-M1]|nr:hypothetical protein EB72_13520 [Mycobacterium sp. SWH-M1]